MARPGAGSAPCFSPSEHAAGPAPSWDTGAVSAAPLFADAAAYDVRPAAGSPAVDAGAPSGIAADADGVARPQGSGFDIGAYEFVP